MKKPSEREALRFLVIMVVGATLCKGCGGYQLPGRKCPTENCEIDE